MIKNIINYFINLLHKDVKENHLYNKDPKDLIATNLFVGKIIEDRRSTCKVVQCHKNNIHVEFSEINCDHLRSYLDVGKVYPVYKHSSKITGMEVWEIAPRHMKWSSSQVLLYWEEDLGWSWDIDC